ncbi:sensor histidine kinase [Paenibacillus sp. SYP-B4298]|uniref:sensor histidine kinase n=1 Tax=Paenibacillus sp. SYP-B4298 TaxID=2996034 RepID=UPI0022DE586D|nr:HAMP domain-containing sensor histidine kinase [Paenibacillus sp. SYP-B4298]
MIKTLYVKVILTYLAVTALALLLASIVTSVLYTKHIIRTENTQLIQYGEEIIRLYKQQGVGNVNAILTSLSDLETFHLQIYDQSSRIFYSSPWKGEKMIAQEVLASIYQGDVYRSSKEFVVGLPFDMEGEPHALILQYRPRGQIEYYEYVLLSMQLLALVIGTLLMGIGARHLIKPLRAMKKAAEAIAKGDFDISLKLDGRKDELGELALSFHYMTHEIKQLENMRQAFVSNVSHEIQSPLTSISGFSKALQQQRVSEQDQQRYLSIIQSESERLSRLCDNLLRLASLDNRSMPLQLSTYDLDEQIRESVLLLEPQWSEKEIDIDIQLPSIRLQADRDQLSQVWTNLIANSIKFTPPRGSIVITGNKGIDQVEIHIQDTGIGIPEEDLNLIFERFFKSDRARSKIKTGNGLGLAIVRKIILLHKGRIFVKSKEGRGATFTVIIPNYLNDPG